jgi:hypothetical protein
MMILASLLVAMGCDGGGGGTDGGPMGGDACVTCPDGGPPPPPVDGGPTGDGNDSFATATPLELGAPESGVINPAGDRDYYSFEGTAGQWIQIFTEANPDDDPALVDTVITLYDSSMRQIAENDDSVPRVNTDSELTVRLPSTGRYYVLVQEYSTWAGETAEGGRTFEYDLTVGQLNESEDAVNVDAEAGDDAASAQALTFFSGMGGGTFSLIAGTLDAGDVDVYSFSMPAGGGSYSVNVMPSGSTGNGSTATLASAWITSADGSEIIARITPTAMRGELAPALAEGDYLLWVSQGGAAGANDFYVLKAFGGGDNPPEAMEAANDVPATAETLTLNAERSGFVLARLTEGDVDHFSFTTMGAERVSVACGSASLGSGVQGLSAALVNQAGDTVITTMNEGPMGVLINAQAVPTAGTYLLRLTSTGQSPEVTGNWVRCGVHLRVPM